MVLSQAPQEAVPIRIKGTGDGLVITVAETLEDWMQALETEFAARPDFWRGGRVVLVVGTRELDKTALEVVMGLLERFGMRLWAVLSEAEDTRHTAREMGFAIRLPGMARKEPRAESLIREVPRPAPDADSTLEPDDEGEPAVPTFLEPEQPEPPLSAVLSDPVHAAAVQPVFVQAAAVQPAFVQAAAVQSAPVLAAAVQPEPVEEAEPEPEGPPAALILKETLRSGRSIRHIGPIIIIGDVNPGAEIHSGGDVIVWGKLRGLVHAGFPDDQTAVVCALDLNPTQLRIADKITIPPKDNRRQPVPEMAVIRDQNIVAEAWRQRS